MIDKQLTHQAQRVCPWWCCFTFDNFLRKLVQNPDRILGPDVKQGGTALDIGPGMGYFTIPLAKLVGNNGKVIAVDLQQKMLDGVRHRALKAGVQDRIELHLSSADSIGISEPIDFCLTFWMVHEVPDRARFINEIAVNIETGGIMAGSRTKHTRFHQRFRSDTGTGQKRRAVCCRPSEDILEQGSLIKKITHFFTWEM